MIDSKQKKTRRWGLEALKEHSTFFGNRAHFTIPLELNSWVLPFFESIQPISGSGGSILA